MTQTIRLMLGLVCALLAGHAAAQRPVLQIATGELAPYATTLRPDNGIALSVVQEAFQIQGFDVRYTFLPWSRALAEAKVGKWDGTAYWGKKPVHETDFWISDNVLTEQWVFVHGIATMLATCVPGVAVLNIDNGFGAAAFAAKMLHPKMLHPEQTP